MLEYILYLLKNLSIIYLGIGILISLIYSLLTHIIKDKEGELTFLELIGTIIFYPIILYYTFNKGKNG